MKGLFVMRDQISENKVELQRAVSHQLNKFIFPVLMQGILSQSSSNWRSEKDLGKHEIYVFHFRLARIERFL